MIISEEVDIAIIGGGMAGASLALLIPEPFSVLVLESFAIPQAAEAPQYQPSFDARATALSHSSYEIFRDAGLWPELQQYAQTILDVHVSDKGHWSSALLRHEQEHMQALGYVVENAWLGQSLLYKLKQKSNVNYCCPATVQQLKPVKQAAELLVEVNGETRKIRAQLAIIVDGAQSKTCQQLGIHTEVRQYGHTGIIANVSTSKPHQGIAYERFTADGPMALLPLIDNQSDRNRSALVWTLPNAKAESLLAANDEDFLAALQKQFGQRQGEFIKVGKRSHYPLTLSMATEQARQNIVVLGNAAHALHPVAGQGFNLALRDIKVLVDTLLAGVKEGKSIGDLSVLQRYVERQRNDQTLTTLFSDVLPGLFSNKNPLLSAGRGLGLLGLELTPGLKSSFVRFSTGIRHQA